MPTPSNDRTATQTLFRGETTRSLLAVIRRRSTLNLVQDSEDGVDDLLDELLEIEKRREGAFYESIRIFFIVIVLLAISFGLLAVHVETETLHLRH